MSYVMETVLSILRLSNPSTALAQGITDFVLFCFSKTFDKYSTTSFLPNKSVVKLSYTHFEGLGKKKIKIYIYIYKLNQKIPVNLVFLHQIMFATGKIKLDNISLDYMLPCPAGLGVHCGCVVARHLSFLLQMLLSLWVIMKQTIVHR